MSTAKIHVPIRRRLSVSTSTPYKILPLEIMSDPKIDATSLLDEIETTSPSSVPAPSVLVNGNATANATADATANKPNGNATKVNSAATVAAPRPRLKTGHSTPNMNGPLYMQTSGSNIVLVRRLRRKDESTWKHLSRWFVENQIGMSRFVHKIPIATLRDACPALCHSSIPAFSDDQMTKAL